MVYKLFTTFNFRLQINIVDILKFWTINLIKRSIGRSRLVAHDLKLCSSDAYIEIFNRVSGNVSTHLLSLWVQNCMIKFVIELGDITDIISRSFKKLTDISKGFSLCHCRIGS
jgi:hypothetical protein